VRPERRPKRKLAPGTDIVAFLKSLDPASRRAAVELLDSDERDALDRAWESWAHEGQLAPPACADGAPWSTWVIKAGRGFGKTLAGAQWVTAQVAAHARAGGPAPRIALVGATLADARRVMVEGKSGLLEVAGAWIADWHPSLNRLRFRTGAEATLFSGATPHLLRGPEHHLAWCDELAKWEKARECWDMLQLGLRLGSRPRALVTTTPRPGPVLKAIMAEPGTVVTGGRTSANPHLPPAWKERVERLYAGTRLGRQELDGELLPDAAGALWTVELIERCRIPPRNGGAEGVAQQQRDREAVEGARGHAQPGERNGGAEAVAQQQGDRRKADPEEARCQIPPRNGEGDRRKAVVEGAGGHTQSSANTPPSPAEAGATSPSRGGFERTLIAVDPPSGAGTCGIVACARTGSGGLAIAHVLADHSVTGRSPEGWASAVAAAARAHGTVEIVAEANQGGKMVKAVLNAANPRLRVRLVHASAGKTTRAEPVAHLFEAGRVLLHGRLPELEAELLGMIAGGSYEGPGTSPDRADAMVWGVAEVIRERGEARVRGM